MDCLAWGLADACKAHAADAAAGFAQPAQRFVGIVDDLTPHAAELCRARRIRDLQSQVFCIVSDEEGNPLRLRYHHVHESLPFQWETIIHFLCMSKDVALEASWKERLSDEFQKPYWEELTSFVKEEYEKGTVYPNPKDIFRAFALCPFDRVKVVILGQDPYHGKGQANGLSFAVNDGVTLPPSLRNIFKEIESDIGAPVGTRSGDLSRWATQGVLLLNATLTVRAHAAGSHQKRGWEEFTDAVIRVLNNEREHLVFILWGNYARAKGAHIDRSKHLVIESPHPSPFSADAGFFGSKPFSKANEYLVAHGAEPIDWT